VKETLGILTVELKVAAPRRQIKAPGRTEAQASRRSSSNLLGSVGLRLSAV